LQEEGSDNDKERDESLDFPRSQSLPNKTWRDTSEGGEDSLFEDENRDSSDGASHRRRQTDGSWEFNLIRDFPGEIQNYFTLKNLKKNQMKE